MKYDEIGVIQMKFEVKSSFITINSTSIKEYTHTMEFEEIEQHPICRSRNLWSNYGLIMSPRNRMFPLWRKSPSIDNNITLQ